MKPEAGLKLRFGDDEYTLFKITEDIRSVEILKTYQHHSYENAEPAVWHTESGDCPICKNKLDLDISTYGPPHHGVSRIQVTGSVTVTPPEKCYNYRTLKITYKDGAVWQQHGIPLEDIQVLEEAWLKR